MPDLVAPSLKPILVRQTRLWAAQLTGWLNVLLSHVPLILMAILTIASFAILKQIPSTSTDGMSMPVSQNDDHYLKQFSTTSYSPQGSAKLVLKGESAHHSPATKEMRLTQLSFVATSETTGAQYTGSAKRGIIADGAKQFSLSDNVVIDKQVISANGSGRAVTHFKGEQIQFTVDPDTVTSTLPVSVQSGKNTMTAGSLHFDNATKQMQLKGRVRMVIERK
jgi:lipopolysaccharide export system protein LptC